jgi:hypothetical protein
LHARLKYLEVRDMHFAAAPGSGARASRKETGGVAHRLLLFAELHVFVSSMKPDCCVCLLMHACPLKHKLDGRLARTRVFLFLLLNLVHTLSPITAACSDTLCDVAVPWRADGV